MSEAYRAPLSPAIAEHRTAFLEGHSSFASLVRATPCRIVLPAATIVSQARPLHSSHLPRRNRAEASAPRWPSALPIMGTFSGRVAYLFRLRSANTCSRSSSDTGRPRRLRRQDSKWSAMSAVARGQPRSDNRACTSRSSAKSSRSRQSQSGDGSGRSCACGNSWGRALAQAQRRSHRSPGRWCTVELTKHGESRG